MLRADMPTKTDRIISYLPGAFRALPRPTALYTLVNAFGRELQQGENSLAALMQAHWVDHSDRGSEGAHKDINDLLKIAAMYGLMPREDEDVEEFREHLKRYIRIFLEGTATVQGILRVTAQALGVQIADAYEDMDTWWTRDSDSITTLKSRRDDAALMLLGGKNASISGSDAQPARIIGVVDLGEGVDLQENSLLKLKVDQDAPIEIDLASGSRDSANVSLQSIINAINTAFPADMASAQGRNLLLRSPTSGNHSRLELLESEKDATAAVLGFAPRTWHGKESQAASVTALADLGNNIDLSQERYLRLLVDNTRLFEVDCAGTDPANTTLDQISDAINTAFGFALASHNGHFLILTSPTTGFTSSIGFLQAAAQGAKDRIFGAVNTFHSGQDAQAAVATGIRDLGGGVDLSELFNIRVETDSVHPITINCAGPDPANTQLPEIVAAINAVLGPGMATRNGRFVSLHSSRAGADSLVFFRAPKSDATGLIFGIGGRVYTGEVATPAHFVASPPQLFQGGDCQAESGCVDVSTVRFLTLAIDDQPAKLINLAEALKQQGKDPRNATLTEIALAVNTEIGDVIAKVVANEKSESHLELASPSTGASSSLAFDTLQQQRKKRFVTRARIADEASELVFGFNAREVRGAAATSAHVTGKSDLRHGIDLSEASLLRLVIDGGSAFEINTAGSRPRATLIDEIVTNINAAVGGEKHIASHDGRRLLLNSPTSGAKSSIVFETPRSTDAIDVLLGVDAGVFRGGEPGGVRFEATVDISESIDLSSASRIKLGIDGAQAIEIDCAGTDPAATRLNEILIAINLVLEMTLASRDGDHIILTSPSRGGSSRIEFVTPESGDATLTIFGIQVPRSYQGSVATPAQVKGKQDLSGSSDLQIARFLQLSVDGGPAVTIDCASGSGNAAAVELADVIVAINTAMNAVIASAADEKYLLLTSPTDGIGSRIGLEFHTGSDARKLLFGKDVPERSDGLEAQPATLTGEIDLLSPVDLSERSVIRLALDGGVAEDIDLAGVAPATTFLHEMIVAINAVFPGMASQTEDDRLRLFASGTGEQSSLALLPSRHLELIEYPPEGQHFSAGDVGHGLGWVMVNKGIADTPVSAQLKTQQGVSGPGLVNMTAGWRLYLPIVVRPAEGVKIWLDKTGKLKVAVSRQDGSEDALSAAEIIVRPLLPTPLSDAVLTLPGGKSDWVYSECISSRFNEAAFDQNAFAGGECRELGVFNVSSFPDESVKFPIPVFAAKDASPLPTTVATFNWAAYLAGSLTVNLPADLPARFGGRFNEAGFGQPQDAPEEFNAAVTEPDTDDMFIGNLFQRNSRLVTAKKVSFVPLGWAAETLPFRKPLKLTLGREEQPAKLYLTEEGLDGFIEVSARTPGEWGNNVSLSARSSAPAMFDIAVFYQGSRFENARQTVLGESLKKRVSETLKPGAIGVLQAKAAGVRARVTRDND
jgi:hypothetical protein